MHFDNSNYTLFNFIISSRKYIGDNYNEHYAVNYIILRECAFKLIKQMCANIPTYILRALMVHLFYFILRHSRAKKLKWQIGNSALLILCIMLHILLAGGTITTQRYDETRARAREIKVDQHFYGMQPRAAQPLLSAAARILKFSTCV